MSNQKLEDEKHYYISEPVDQALDEILTLILDEYVYLWYKNITIHDQFADEIRLALRNSFSAIVKRLTKIDIAGLISDTVLSCLISNISIYKEASAQLQLNFDKSINFYIVKILKERATLHSALWSREAETSYLKSVINNLHSYIFPIQHQNSLLCKSFVEELLGGFLGLKGMDLLADPETVNFLLLLLLNKSFSSPICSQMPTDQIDHNQANHKFKSFDDPGNAIQVNSNSNSSYVDNLSQLGIVSKLSTDSFNKFVGIQNSPVIFQETSDLYQFVPILKSFSTVNTYPRHSSLRNNLSSVLKDQKLLYLFHNFLKSIDSVNFLSFCLSVEDFNRLILNPELCESHLDLIHKEACDIYRNYMAVDSKYFIPFNGELSLQIKVIIESGLENVIKLRTTRPLFQAYEFAYNILEREFIPVFMNSWEYFQYLCCNNDSNFIRKSSEKESTSSGKRLAKNVVKKMGSSLVNFGKQISLKPSVVYGIEPEDNLNVEKGADVSGFIMENINRPILFNPLESWRHTCDLSAWCVTIPKAELTRNEMGKLDFIFIVDVKRIDGENGVANNWGWKVGRRPNEFYVLESKLKEFHGDILEESNVYLPSRKTFLSRGNSLLHSRREVFEEFLQNLLQKPFLKNSQLLFLFLKSKGEFTESFLPDFSLGQFLKDVPRKLIKEKGQNLDSFILTFMSEADFIKRLKHLPIHDEDSNNLYFETSLKTSRRKPKITDLYQDNAAPFLTSPSICSDDTTEPATKNLDSLIVNRDLNANSNSLSANLDPNNVNSDQSNTNFSLLNKNTDLYTTNTSFIIADEHFQNRSEFAVNGILDAIMYLVVCVYQISRLKFNLLYFLKYLFGNMINNYLYKWLQNRIKALIVPNNLVLLINATRDALFYPTKSSTNVKSEKLNLEKELLNKLNEVTLNYFIDCIFSKRDLESGNELIVNSFQNPLLNKQLSYVLLDAVIEKIFPEIKSKPQ